jgi:hypothetical protein
MAEVEWQPNSEDVYAGQEAYIRYIGGVVLLHDPDSDISHGIYGAVLRSEREGVEAVIRHAENLMYFNLQAFIACANPPDFRSPIVVAEHRHKEALPHIRQMIGLACMEQAVRLDSMNTAVRAIRPNPLADQALYSYLCHGRRHKLSTVRLMDGLMPAPEFAGYLSGRMVHGQGKGSKRRQTNSS